MKYKIVGLCKSMTSVFVLKTKKDGSKVFTQRPIRKGISFEVDESELTFHVERLRIRKALKVVPVEDVSVVEVPPLLGPPISPPEVIVDEKKPKKRKYNKKKKEEEKEDVS